MNKAVFVIPFIIVCLLAAIWSGWIRIGISLPVTKLAAHHGSLMINGFLASLILLERATTFHRKIILLLPLINAASVLMGIFNIPYFELVHLGCCAGFVLMCIYFIYRYKELYYYVFLAAAICLLAGNIVLYKTHLYPAAIVWWMEFLLFTIVAERLELTQFLPLKTSRKILLIGSLALVFISGILPFHLYGNIAFAIALAFTAFWLLKYDMAYKSIKAKGQHRYSGLLLITGYCWLIVTAIVFIAWNNFAFGYDAVIHSFFIGFVFSMIFSHAPIILPAVLKMPVKIFRPRLYLWFVLLQASLLVRVIADIAEDAACRKYAGFTTGIIILVFFINIVLNVRSELKKRNGKTGLYSATNTPAAPDSALAKE